MNMDLNDMNALAKQCEANSERWFAHLHDLEITSPAERLKHLTLGLVEEVAELNEVLRDQRLDMVPYEMVDVLVYAVNIAAMEDIDLSGADTPTWSASPETIVREMSITAGAIAGVVKKKTGYRADQAKHSDGSPLQVLLPVLLRRLSQFSIMMKVDLQTALNEKTAVCEERWG